jgi:hypothetical protein
MFWFGQDRSVRRTRQCSSLSAEHGAAAQLLKFSGDPCVTARECTQPDACVRGHRYSTQHKSGKIAVDQFAGQIGTKLVHRPPGTVAPFDAGFHCLVDSAVPDVGVGNPAGVGDVFF